MSAPKREWVDWRQAEILADRYFAVLLGRLGSLALFLLQGPLIALMIVGVWKGSQPDQRLELFLCLAAIWVGCMNACREIVSERAIYRRERMVFLQIRAYVLSKVAILAILDALQAAAMLWIVHYWVGLPGDKLLLFLTLFLGTLMGTVLGLLVSALVSTPDKAVALVPLVILPQILLSRPFSPGRGLKGLVATAEKCMPLRWNHELYRAVVDLRKEWDFGALLTDAGACILITVLLYLATCFALWFWDDQ